MKKRILIIALVICILLTVIIGAVPVSSAEVEKQYSDVMMDLQKDSKFNVADYPSVIDSNNEKYDYLEVIQIAESVDKELFIYAYQPADYVRELELWAVLMSDEYCENGNVTNPTIYELELVSTSDVFDKYLVKGYTVSDEAKRYYNIVAVYRPFIEGFDENVHWGETNGYAYEVCQQWCAYWLNGHLYYDLGKFETVDIVPLYNGEIGFTEGFTLGNWVGRFQEGTLHYLAFDVDDYIVTHIYDADVFFVTQDYSYSIGLGLSGDKTYYEEVTHVVTLTDDGHGTYEAEGFLGYTYTWDEISTGIQFRDNLLNQSVSFTATQQTALASYPWVFAFYESASTTYVSSVGTTTFYGTVVSNVTVLRLHFFDARLGELNLGAVMNITTSDGILDGIGNSSKSSVDDIFEKLYELIQKIFSILGIVLLAVIVCAVFPILSTAVKLIYNAVVFTVRLFVTIIIFPFRVFRRRR